MPRGMHTSVWVYLYVISPSLTFTWAVRCDACGVGLEEEGVGLSPGWDSGCSDMQIDCSDMQISHLISLESPLQFSLGEQEREECSILF